MIIQTLEGEKETLQASETQLRSIINQSVERRSQDVGVQEYIKSRMFYMNGFLLWNMRESKWNHDLICRMKVLLILPRLRPPWFLVDRKTHMQIEKTDEIKSLHNQLVYVKRLIPFQNDTRSQLQEKIAFMVHIVCINDHRTIIVCHSKARVVSQRHWRVKYPNFKSIRSCNNR